MRGKLLGEVEAIDRNRRLHQPSEERREARAMDEPRRGGDYVKLAEASHESGVKDLPSNAVIDSAEFVDISLITPQNQRCALAL